MLPKRLVAGWRRTAPRLWYISDPEGFAAGAAEIVRFSEAIDQNIAEAIPHYQQQEFQYRDRFLGMLGHDLRNPIQSVSLCATMLAEQGLDVEQQRIVLLISRSTHHLNRMVSDILDFARGGRLGSPMPLALAQTNLEALIRDGSMKSKSLILRARYSSDLAEIQTERGTGSGLNR